MNIEQPIKRRNPFVSFLLSIFTPGLAQIYNGQLKKASIILAIILICYIVLSVFNVGATFYGNIATLAILYITRLYGIIDGIIQAIRLKNYTLKKINSYSVYIGWGFLSLGTILMFFYLGAFGVQSYTVPTSGMSPTIQPKDYIVTNKRVKPNDIKIGDIIAFDRGVEGIYISRVVGLPNDTVRVEDDIVIINNIKAKIDFIKKTMSEQFVVNELLEALPNGLKHSIYIKDKDNNIQTQDVSNTDDYIVPEGYFFLVSDNRDLAVDSRYIGFIKQEDLVGKVEYILLRYAKTKNNKNIVFNIKL